MQGRRTGRAKQALAGAAGQSRVRQSKAELGIDIGAKVLVRFFGTFSEIADTKGKQRKLVNEVFRGSIWGKLRSKGHSSALEGTTPERPRAERWRVACAFQLAIPWQNRTVYFAPMAKVAA